MRTIALAFGWRRHFRVGFSLSILLAIWTLAASTIAARADDLPARRTARLSFVQGAVTVDHLDNTAGDPAEINMPLLEGARLTTAEDGQAEIEFEDGSIVRVTPNSSVGLTALSVDASGNFHTQLTILHGLVYTELRASDKFTYSVSADGVVVSPVSNATIRINLDQVPAIVSVLDGTAQVEHASSAQTDGYKANVHAGEALTGDTSDSGRYFLLQSVEPDSWDQWNQDRDQAAADAAADRTAARDAYAGDQGYGWSDLDANGSWYDVPGQGQVWQPTIAVDAADFDPYGYGSWVASPGAGYIWASGYPWGWTPFRCGSWSYWNSFGWGWSPAAGCGFARPGFGGIFVINVARGPVNYRLPTRPIHEPGMLHPIPVGHAPRESTSGLRPSHEPRLIAGVPVQPMQRIGAASTPGSHSVVGAALRNDYAVDHISRQPVLGAVSKNNAATPNATTSRGDFHSVSPRPVAPPAAANESAPQSTQMRPAPSSPQRSSYPAHTEDEHSASRPSAPAYTPRSAPPPSAPPAPRTPPPPPPAPATPRTSQPH